MVISLAKYRMAFPNKKMFDLSQSIERARTDLKHGDMLCLATSSTHLWSESLGRCLSGKEKLKSLLYPIEKLDDTSNEFPERVLTKFAGNGMFLPNVGWAMLCHVLNVLPLEQWLCSSFLGRQKEPVEQNFDDPNILFYHHRTADHD